VHYDIREKNEPEKERITKGLKAKQNKEKKWKEVRIGWIKHAIEQKRDRKGVEKKQGFV